MSSIPLLLGSATPDVCSYYHASNGRYQHLRLTKRANASDLAKVTIVDMKEEILHGIYSVFSDAMSRLIQKTIRKALADELLFGRLAEGGEVLVDVDQNDKVVLNFEDQKAVKKLEQVD